MSRFLSKIRRGVPPWIIVAFGLLVSFDVIRIAIRPLTAGLQYLSRLSDAIPRWAGTLFGLFIVVVVVGIALSHIYLLFESFILFLVFGRSALRINLRRLARQDFLLLVRSFEQDHGATRPYAVLLAIVLRLARLPDLIRRLRNIESSLGPERYRDTVRELAKGWQDGVDSYILLDLITTLDRLPAPLPSDRLLGQAVAANITYLFGDLVQGRRLADRTMIEAKRVDVDGLAVYQWLASYAHANSRLFLGQFAEAASLLGVLWRSKYVSLPENKRKELLVELHERSTLNPIAAVPRHMILASAFAGRALRRPETQPRASSTFEQPQDRSQKRAPVEARLVDDRAWIKDWYEIGQELCHSDPREGDEAISLHFTHGYMSLYCLVVDDSLEDPRKVLDRIPQTARAVSLYVKHGMRGLCCLKDQCHEEALEELRRADSYSRVSGNRFFDGIFLPAHAVAALRVKGPRYPEVNIIRLRALAHRRLAHSAFYDSLVAALDAVIALAEHKPAKFNRLKERADRWQPGGLVKIYRLDEASHSSPSTFYPDRTIK